MNNISFAFTLSILAGFSTMLGTIFIFKKKNENMIIGSLAFASGVMFTVSITDLIPESYSMLINIFPKFPAILYVLIFVVSGIILSMIIDKYIPTDNNLYRVGVFAMLAIIVHNIPEGISISIPIYYATNSKFKAIFYTFISAISEPFGALITYLFLSNYINDRIMGFLFGIIAGIMIHISMYELLPTSKKYNNHKLTYLFFILGVILMLINHFVF